MCGAAASMCRCKRTVLKFLRPTDAVKDHRRSFWRSDPGSIAIQRRPNAQNDCVHNRKSEDVDSSSALRSDIRHCARWPLQSAAQTSEFVSARSEATKQSSTFVSAAVWIAHMGNVCVKDEQSPFCSTAATSSSRPRAVQDGARRSSQGRPLGAAAQRPWP